MTAGLKTLSDGYLMYNKEGQPFVILDLKGRPNVIVPKELVNWLTHESPNVFSARPVQYKKFGLKYWRTSDRINSQQYESAFVNTIRVLLSRKIGKMQAEIFDTMRETIDARMGLDETSWREVNLFATLQPVIFKSIGCAVFGAPLCKNDDFLNAFQAFNTGLGAGAILLGQCLPSFICPLVGYLYSIPVSVYRTRVLRFIVPVVEERKKRTRLDKADPQLADDWSTDLMTQGLTTFSEETTLAISNDLLALMLGAIASTTMAATNAFVDILCSSPEFCCYDRLREEVVLAINTEEDWLDPAFLMKLPCTDSAIRESLRQNPLQARPVVREVVHKDGTTIPGGSHLPPGTWVGVAANGLHRDERFYPEPNTYDPFRFSRERTESALISGVGRKETVGVTKSGRNQLSTTSDTFVSFGHGRFACPGRWLASHLLKLMLAYVVLNYDIQPLDKRPADILFADQMVPSRNTIIKVRRRKLIK
ncbi:hypothetical protein MMC29_001134 [Sticta canariensis]|nr:hypothetical protein [Sticta canariensis]